MNQYRRDLDIIKGIAILGVVLFHFGLIKSGYLGVDAFFVINGFLLIPSLFKKIGNGEFDYLDFLKKRVCRLWPLIIIASVVSMIIGYMVMLPDDYENLSQSVIASNIFSQNILSSITVSNYWNTVNDYKPLMHLWYVGILMEFYIFMPIILLLSKYVADKGKWDRMIVMKSVVGVLIIFSFLLYITPIMSDGDKFYLLPCRFFELSIGGWLAVTLKDVKIKSMKGLSALSWIICVFIIFSSLFKFNINSIGSFTPIVGDDTHYDDGIILSRVVLLILTVISSTAICIFRHEGVKSAILEWMGKRSYGIFIWHQVLLAFYRYCISTEITFEMVMGLLVLTAILSELSYRVVEQKVEVSTKSVFLQALVSIAVVIFAFNIYTSAGVVRDVPELEIKKGEGKKGMFAEYCDRNFKYDKEFDNNGKINVLVAGISYGRDFCNVIKESNIADSVNISYVEMVDNLPKYLERLEEADILFVFSAKNKIPSSFWNSLKRDAIVYGIGSKAYGTNNGNLYFNRNSDDYYNSTVKAISGLTTLNEKWKKEWGTDRYIDFVSPVLVKQGNGEFVKVFTPDHKFISQDCRHLTPAGAKWYANMLKIDSIIMHVGTHNKTYFHDFKRNQKQIIGKP